MTLPKITPLSGGIAALLFLTGAALSFVGLSWLAQPSDFAARVKAAEAAEQAMLAPNAGAPRRFPDTAVCNQATIPASQALRRTLAELTSRHGLAVADLQTAPASPERALSGLAGIDVQLTATGGQANAHTLIAALERASPAVFLDRLELRPKGGAVELRLSGRAFCAIPARR